FQTIQRQEVGTILKVTPTISAEGTSLMLKISIESSSIGQKPAGAVDLVTNKRTITTTVLIEDGGVVVLGGLIEDNSVKGEQRVPYLGNIPLIGLLFNTRNATSTKNNLILFIRPKILRDPAQAAFETDLKYNYMMDQQKDLSRREALPLLPGVSRGKLERPPDAQFDELLRHAYEAGSDAMQAVEGLDDTTDLAHLAQELPEQADLLDSEDDAPIIRLINAVLTQAVKENASDIHVEPFENRLVVRFRVDGVLREVLQSRRAVAPLVVSRIKVMSRLDIAEKRLPQDGRISLKIAGRAVDVRVSTIPSGHGERVV